MESDFEIADLIYRKSFFGILERQGVRKASDGSRVLLLYPLMRFYSETGRTDIPQERLASYMLRLPFLKSSSHVPITSELGVEDQ